MNFNLSYLQKLNKQFVDNSFPLCQTLLGSPGCLVCGIPNVLPTEKLESAVLWTNFARVFLLSPLCYQLL